MKTRPLHILLLAIMLASLFIPTRVAYAATITVESFGDGVADPAHCPGASCTLRDAIAKASAGDKITFNMSGFPTATITLTQGELVIDKNLTIQGPGSSVLTIDANHASRIFRVGVFITAINVSISGMTITSGNATSGGGGIQVYYTGSVLNSLSLNDVIITQNTSNGYFGGGIDSGGNLTITNSYITDNYSDSSGGGIYSASGGTLNLSHVVVSGNQITAPPNGNGGGMYVDSSQSKPSTMTLDHVDISTNTARGGGGGMYIGSYATGVITNSSFNGNTADNSGGGIYFSDSADFTISTSTFDGNQSLTAGGGGIYLNGNLTLSDSTISSNSADTGAGILVSVNSTLEGSALTINDNIAISYAGGISNNGTTHLVNTTIATNSSTDGVGGIDSNKGTVNLQNVTISGNSSTNFVGGVRNTAGSTMNFKNSILANSVGGGVYATKPDCDDGTLTSEDYNLFETIGDTCSMTGTTTHDLTGIDPMLGVLTNNGGATKTMLPQAGSPVIDAANNATCAAKDQRGVTRPQDGDDSGFATCDMGAVEIVGNLLVQSVTRLNSNPTNASTASFLVKFTEPVTGVDTTAPFADFELSPLGLVGASIASVTGSGAEYTVQVNTGTGEGSVGVDVADNDSITSIATGLPLGGVGNGNGDYLDGERYTVDRTSPEISNIAMSSSNPTNASSVDYTITFSEPVSGVNIGVPLPDFSLTTSGVTGAAISGVNTADNITYTVTVNTGSGNGSVQLNLGDNDSIVDAAGNPLGGAGTGNGDAVGGIYSITKSSSLTVTKLADTYDVSCDSDCSLRDAVASALDGTTITFAPGLSGTITLTTNEVSINKNITIVGPGVSTLTISGNDTYRVMVVNPGKTVSISNLTIAHGLSTDDEGGGILNNGNLTLDHVTVSNCQANYATTLGLGGGIATNAGILTITNSLIKDNSAGKLGGGIFTAAGANLSITDTVFDHNTASDAGGGLYFESASGVTTTIALNRISMVNNIASGSGGGGIYLTSSASITNSLLANNSASGFAGGGGGLKIYEDGSGDPITVSVENVTISGNTTVGQGGGVDVSLQQVADAVTFNNVTIADNHRNVMPGPPAVNGGGGIFASGAELLDLHNTIVAGNTSVVGGADCEGSINSLDYNLIQDTTACTLTGAMTHNKTGVDPLLGALADNGGSTLTMSLLTGSPALNAADNSTCPAKDQRGATRPQGAKCDMGAFEAIVKLTTKLLSIGSQDGWILESGENTDKGGVRNSAGILFVGDDAAKKQYRGILSFKTSGLPDSAVITKVTLKLKKNSITGGGNPIVMFGGFMVDVKKGTFGTAPLQATDFAVVAGKSVGPFKPALAGGWYSINLTSARTFINKLTPASGLTQIRLRFKMDDNNNAIANYLSLFSGDAATASRPQLIVEYYVP